MLGILMILALKERMKNLALDARIRLDRLNREDLIYRTLPVLTLEIVRKYFRIRCEGTENIPKKGRAIVVSNHSGYAGFDAIMIANEIRRNKKRIGHLVAHKLWFLGEPVRVFSEKMGFVEADTNECLKLLNKDELLVLFPEGEEGNFKPSSRRYRLQEFRRGFVRLAMITGAPIVPCFVVGAEESQINLAQIRWAKYVLGTVVPVPLNIIPLPTRWTIRFLPPIYLPNCSPADALNRKKVLEISQQIRRDLQRAIVRELRQRKQEGVL